LPSLHVNIAEFLNAEIGLGTIKDIETAQAWLRSTFFHQRIQRNPAHYRLDKESSQTWAERVEEVVTLSVGELRKENLVSSGINASAKLASTPFGDIMSKYYIRLSTVCRGQSTQSTKTHSNFLVDATSHVTPQRCFAQGNR
jgi:ATP-dependent DNA helicase HFM1/MER3